MERTISQEERIRRAEEVYSRRKQVYNNRQYNDRYIENENTKISMKARLTKKLFYQIFICLLIYLTLYAILNSGYFFSDSVRDKINEFLSYDIQFSNLYNGAKSYIYSDDNIIKKMFNSKQTIVENTNETENTESENVSNENVNEEVNINAIGGAEENDVAESKSQMDIDADYIKQNFSIIWPLKGVITSKYGTRQATEIVTANHYGIDIAGNTGDTIVAAMNGNVEIASSDGEYGKHIQIKSGEISNLYAHCSKLCVAQGENVKQGQKIAEVGSTGRATGPHLHFEIKREDRTIDPEKIL